MCVCVCERESEGERERKRVCFSVPINSSFVYQCHLQTRNLSSSPFSNQQHFNGDRTGFADPAGHYDIGSGDQAIKAAYVQPSVQPGGIPTSAGQQACHLEYCSGDRVSNPSNHLGPDETDSSVINNPTSSRSQSYMPSRKRDRIMVKGTIQLFFDDGFQLQGIL